MDDDQRPARGLGGFQITLTSFVVLVGAGVGSRTFVAAVLACVLFALTISRRWWIRRTVRGFARISIALALGIAELAVLIGAVQWAGFVSGLAQTDMRNVLPGLLVCAAWLAGCKASDALHGNFDLPYTTDHFWAGFVGREVVGPLIKFVSKVKWLGKLSDLRSDYVPGFASVLSAELVACILFACVVLPAAAGGINLGSEIVMSSKAEPPTTVVPTDDAPDDDRSSEGATGSSGKRPSESAPKAKTTVPEKQGCSPQLKIGYPAPPEIRRHLNAAICGDAELGVSGPGLDEAGLPREAIKIEDSDDGWWMPCFLGGQLKSIVVYSTAYGTAVTYDQIAREARRLIQTKELAGISPRIDLDQGDAQILYLKVGSELMLRPSKSAPYTELPPPLVGPWMDATNLFGLLWPKESGFEGGLKQFALTSSEDSELNFTASCDSKSNRCVVSGAHHEFSTDGLVQPSIEDLPAK